MRRELIDFWRLSTDILLQECLIEVLLENASDLTQFSLGFTEK